MGVHGHANVFAYFALLIWPVVTLYLFSTLTVPRAILWSILGASLLLPVGAEIKLAMIPVFDKRTIPNIAVLGCCLLFARQRPKLNYGFGVTEALLAILILSPFVTSLLNDDPIDTGQFILPGVGPYDAGSAVIFQLVFMLPFFLGRQFLRTPEDNLEIMRVLVIAGLAYSLPILFEIKMSPQLHIWIYGFFPSGWLDEVRAGGFRPVVFLGHGLLLAFFIMTTVVASATLWRLRIRIDRFPPAPVFAYLTAILVLCRTASALLYGLVAFPLARWAKPRWQLRIATMIVMVAVTYPILRAADLVPTTYILRAAYSVSEDRAESLNTRFTQEGRLLSKAWQRKWFGWGRYGRNRVYEGYEGRDDSISDGYWIITLGTFGIVGFTALFGLLAFTVLRARTALKFAQSREDRVLLGALSLIVAINMLDLLPNSSISPWGWLLAGSLLGRAEALRALARQKVWKAAPDVLPIGLQKHPG